MAKREARRFFGISGGGLGRDAVYFIAMLIAFGGFYLVEPYVKQFQLVQDGLGWFLLIGVVAVTAAIYFVLKRLFGVHFWGRPRYKFYRRGRPNKPRDRQGWRWRT